MNATTKNTTAALILQTALAFGIVWAALNATTAHAWGQINSYGGYAMPQQQQPQSAWGNQAFQPVVPSYRSNSSTAVIQGDPRGTQSYIQYGDTMYRLGPGAGTRTWIRYGNDVYGQ
jgi:hypothetical protein